MTLFMFMIYDSQEAIIGRDSGLAPDGTKALAEPMLTKTIAAYMRPSAAIHLCVYRHLHRWKECHWCVDFTSQ